MKPLCALIFAVVVGWALIATAATAQILQQLVYDARKRSAARIV